MANSALLNLGTVRLEIDEEQKRREANRTVGIVCVLEISQWDLDKMKDGFQELHEARRNIEEGLQHMNYKTKLLDPDWQGWRVKSFAVDPITR